MSVPGWRSVTVKKNRRAKTVELMVGAPTGLSV